MLENLLPIGTVVTVKGALKKAMIIGYMQVLSKEPDKIYDYAGVIYPAGNMGPNSQFLFNSDDIVDVVYRGYENSEWNELLTVLQKELDEKPELAERLKNR